MPFNVSNDAIPAPTSQAARFTGNQGFNVSERFGGIASKTGQQRIEAAQFQAGRYQAAGYAGKLGRAFSNKVLDTGIDFVKEVGGKTFFTGLAGNFKPYAGGDEDMDRIGRILELNKDIWSREQAGLNPGQSSTTKEERDELEALGMDNFIGSLPGGFQGYENASKKFAANQLASMAGMNNEQLEYVAGKAGFSGQEMLEFFTQGTKQNDLMESTFGGSKTADTFEIAGDYQGVLGEINRAEKAVMDTLKMQQHRTGFYESNVGAGAAAALQTSYLSNRNLGAAAQILGQPSDRVLAANPELAANLAGSDRFAGGEMQQPEATGNFVGTMMVDARGMNPALGILNPFAVSPASMLGV